MAIPDKFHRDLQKLIKEANPQSMEEMQQFLDSLMGKPLPEVPAGDLTPEDKALGLVDEAWQSAGAKGRKLAGQALQIWPDCIPAYEYLAAKTKPAKERLGYFQKAVEIGQRVFGGTFLEENRGHFWGITETRSYMRCLDALAHENYLAGNFSKAIVIWEDMLSLNPNDNQGVRYSLLPALLAQKDIRNYRRYRKQFEEDTAMMYFNDALASFIENSGERHFHIEVAMANNPYAAPLLLAEKAPEPSSLPGSYALNSPEEAMIYVHETWSLWHSIPGAIEWLKQQQASSTSKIQEKPAAPLEKLPPDSIRILHFDPFNPLSPLQLRPGLTDEAVVHLSFLQLTQKLLTEIKAQQPLKLTTKGNLPRKTVHQLYDLRLYTDKYIDNGTIKLMGEEDFWQLNVSHTLCNMAGLINKKHGKASLSKKGEKLLDSPGGIYLELLKIFTQKFNWAYPERWGYGVDQTGQWGWACILYEILRQGSQETSDKHYGSLYLRLFPDLLRAYPISEIGTPEEKLQSDFTARFFYRFCHMFGLVEITREIKGKYDLTEEFFVRRTELAEKVFQLVSLT